MVEEKLQSQSSNPDYSYNHNKIILMIIKRIITLEKIHRDYEWRPSFDAY